MVSGGNHIGRMALDVRSTKEQATRFGALFANKFSASMSLLTSLSTVMWKGTVPRLAVLNRAAVSISVLTPLDKSFASVAAENSLLTISAISAVGATGNCKGAWIGFVWPHA